jgi:CRP/FNR family cyclic AMP-dependent transcriptional regulator
MTTIDTGVIAHPFLNGLSEEDFELAIKGAKEVEFQPGEIIFREGDPANRFFLIRTGKVVLEAHDRGTKPLFIQEIGGGEVLGWSWLFPPFCWHFEARVLETTQALVLDGGHLLVASEENHDFGYRFMKRISQIVIQRLQATRHK